jgi:hypothetical protein
MKGPASGSGSPLLSRSSSGIGEGGPASHRQQQAVRHVFTIDERKTLIKVRWLCSRVPWW